MAKRVRVRRIRERKGKGDGCLASALRVFFGVVAVSAGIVGYLVYTGELHLFPKEVRLLKTGRVVRLESYASKHVYKDRWLYCGRDVKSRGRPTCIVQGKSFGSVISISKSVIKSCKGQGLGDYDECLAYYMLPRARLALRFRRGY